jgi:SAM-dependent methyltransferase
LLIQALRRLLACPLTAGLSLDDPSTTEIRKQVILSKPFLREIYDEWYRMITREMPPVSGAVLELGSGAGHCESFLPGLITSEVFFCSTVHLVANAQRLPFGDASLRAIVFTDVMHHIPDVSRFFKEASRCLRPGGKILMVEPWVSRWSSFVYKRFHHEPFQPEAHEWAFPSSGPLSDANGALPWIVFVRDRKKFETTFPEFEIEQIRPFLPFRYLLSGGLAMRSLMPEFTYRFWTRFERRLEPRMNGLAMFAFVALKKR